MAEVKTDGFIDETTEMILVLPESSNMVNDFSVIAPSSPVAGTVTVTVQSQTAANLSVGLDTQYFEAPYENSVIDVSDGGIHTFLFPIGTMIKKIKFTPSAAFAYSVKCASARP